jgi:hypothetical protein
MARTAGLDGKVLGFIETGFIEIIPYFRACRARTDRRPGETNG